MSKLYEKIINLIDVLRKRKANKYYDEAYDEYQAWEKLFLEKIKLFKKDYYNESIFQVIVGKLQTFATLPKKIRQFISNCYTNCYTKFYTKRKNLYKKIENLYKKIENLDTYLDASYINFIYKPYLYHYVFRHIFRVCYPFTFFIKVCYYYPMRNCFYGIIYFIECNYYMIKYYIKYYLLSCYNFCYFYYYFCYDFCYNFCYSCYDFCYYSYRFFYNRAVLYLYWYPFIRGPKFAWFAYSFFASANLYQMDEAFGYELNLKWRK